MHHISHANTLSCWSQNDNSQKQKATITLCPQYKFQFSCISYKPLQKVRIMSSFTSYYFIFSAPQWLVPRLCHSPLPISPHFRVMAITRQNFMNIGKNDLHLRISKFFEFDFCCARGFTSNALRHPVTPLAHFLHYKWMSKHCDVLLEKLNVSGHRADIKQNNPHQQARENSNHNSPTNTCHFSFWRADRIILFLHSCKIQNTACLSLLWLHQMFWEVW